MRIVDVRALHAAHPDAIWLANGRTYGRLLSLERRTRPDGTLSPCWRARLQAVDRRTGVDHWSTVTAVTRRLEFAAESAEKFAERT